MRRALAGETCGGSKRGRGGGARGFTLVEAISAIVVLSVAAPALLLAAREAQGARASAALACRARWLAVERLEEVIADRHSAVRGYGHLVVGNYPDEAEVEGFPGFSRSVSLVETGADLVAAGEGCMTVTATVSWTDGRGRARSFALSTVLTDYTP